MKKTILTQSGKILSLIVLAGITLTGIFHSEDGGKANAEQGAADEAASDRTKVEFFERLYKVKIDGVKPLEKYKDPDSFYAAIAEQVGIPQKAFDAVEKKYGWKQNEEFFLSAMVKGGPDGDYWDVMVTRFPAALKEAKPKEEKRKPLEQKEEIMKLLEQMEMKMIVIDYEGTISFPEERDAAEQDSADQPAAAPESKPGGKEKPKPSAKRAAPKPVSPVVANSVEYSAPHEQMGFVVATDVSSRKELWRVRIYTVHIDPSIERDVQDIFITSLSLEHGRLVITNERGDRYSLDLVTRKVAKHK